MIDLTIDGKKVMTAPGSTILQAALNNGLYIPNLCYDKRLRPYGGCRLCVVEVQGQGRLFAACSSPAEQGMVVMTETPKLAKVRRTVLELLLVHHPLDCHVCDKAGECELQDLAFKYGTSRSRFSGHRKDSPERLDAPIVEMNSNRCILCGKCVRVCYEHQGVGAINIIGRGFKSKISPAFEETLDCEFCGQCIDACPVGALGSKSYRYRSRAWYMDEHPIACPYCGCGCTTSLGLRNGKIIRARGRQGTGINDGNLCSKGRFGFDYVYSEDRLKNPMIRKNGELTKVSWEEALDYVAGRLQDIRKEHGSSAVGAIGSQRCTMEDNYMLQKFMRYVIGSDNIDSAARLGYARAQAVFEKAFGLDSLPIGWESPLHADFILVIDSDIASTMPVWGLNFIKARNEGATLVVADSWETKLARNSTDWLRIKPGSGAALLNGVMKVIVDEGLFNKENAAKAQQFDALLSALKSVSLASVSEMTGLTGDAIVKLARSYAAAGRRLVAMTAASSENTKSLKTLLAAANMVLLMGDGVDTLQIPAEFSNTLGMWMIGVRPLAGGKDAYEMLYKPGSIKGLYIMGENPLVSFPDVNAVEETMKSLDFVVVQDIVLTETAKRADVVLPACSWAEKEGTFMNACGNVQEIPKLIVGAGESLADWEIFRNLALLMKKDLGITEITDIRAAISDMAATGRKDEFRPSFNPVAFDAAAETASEDYPVYLVTWNILQHSGAMSALSGNLDSVVSDAFLRINSKDADKYRVKDKGFVKVASKRGEVFLKAVVSDEVQEGTVFAPVHFAHARINTLTYPALDDRLPLVAVRIEAV